MNRLLIIISRSFLFDQHNAAASAAVQIEHAVVAHYLAERIGLGVLQCGVATVHLGGDGHHHHRAVILVADEGGGVGCGITIGHSGLAVQNGGEVAMIPIRRDVHMSTRKTRDKMRFISYILRKFSFNDRNKRNKYQQRRELRQGATALCRFMLRVSGDFGVGFIG